jgi:hypothetical protein
VAFFIGGGIGGGVGGAIAANAKSKLRFVIIPLGGGLRLMAMNRLQPNATATTSADPLPPPLSLIRRVAHSSAILHITPPAELPS